MKMNADAAYTHPSAIQIFDWKTGVLKTTITIMGEALTYEHALSNIAVDGAGRIYALSTQLDLIRFTKVDIGYVQEAYGAPLPDLPTCAAAPDSACSPTYVDRPPIVNDIVFDPNGYAYVTDSLHATIFRYAPGGQFLTFSVAIYQLISVKQIGDFDAIFQEDFYTFRFTPSYPGDNHFR